MAKSWTKDHTKDWTKANWGAARLVARTTGMDQPPDSVARRVVSMGWHPDVPDRRDQTLASPRVRDTLKKVKSSVLSSNSLPASCDHRAICSPVEDQGRLGSCTAQAVVGLMEYMMRRGDVDHVDGSRLFVYKVTRKLLGWDGDTGAYLRTAMKAVAAFGVPPERHWPYDIDKFEVEPSPFLYSFAGSYKSLDYTRLDPAGEDGTELLDRIKRALAAGFPVVFGFSVYRSLSAAADIPYPDDNDTLEGGHAVMAVGYDDNHKVGRKKVPSLIIRNSWGSDWGELGYGYLPYAYVTGGLARDFWTAFKTSWLETKQFG